jgi:photosynthetic reaction center cytochrome c subunit
MRGFSVALALATAALAVSCDRPPLEVTQKNFRGLGIEQVQNPRRMAPLLEANRAPDPLPPVQAGSPPSASVYRNVQVLGDVGVAEFTRLMAAMTSWVSPEEGCTYCHAGDLATDAPYTKLVARRMLEMTRDINTNWKDHVGDTGVTCFTCHRGHPVPEQVWTRDPGPAQAGGFARGNAGQNTPAAAVGLTSLPFDPFTTLLGANQEIRVQSKTALPAENHRSIQETEATYALMVHISDSLGVNCTHCHNTRSFMPWEASSPARVTAYHAIKTVRHLNETYLEPLAAILPAERKGPEGDAFKVNCITCHRGLPKPLGGVSMVQHYPELVGPAGD